MKAHLIVAKRTRNGCEARPNNLRPYAIPWPTIVAAEARASSAALELEIEECGFGDAGNRARVEAGIAPDTRVELVTLQDSGGSNSSLTRAGVRAIGQALLPPALQTQGRTPPLAAFEYWQRLQGERVWALMPYQLEIE